MKLVTDLDPVQSKKLLEFLRRESDLLEGKSNDEIATLLNVFKILTFKR